MLTTDVHAKQIDTVKQTPNKYKKERKKESEKRRTQNNKYTKQIQASNSLVT